MADVLVINRMVRQFRRASLVYEWGQAQEDDNMEIAGAKSLDQAIDILDSCGPEGRMGLVPLLEDPEAYVRSMAAGYLLKVAPEVALPALKKMYLSLEPRARMLAVIFLRSHENGDEPA